LLLKKKAHLVFLVTYVLILKKSVCQKEPQSPQDIHFPPSNIFTWIIWALFGNVRDGVLGDKFSILSKKIHGLSGLIGGFVIRSTTLLGTLLVLLTKKARALICRNKTVQVGIFHLVFLNKNFIRFVSIKVRFILSILVGEVVGILA